MADATIVAVVILLGVFSLMALTLHKHGIDDALKLWSGLGAITGVALGAITSYYFTKASTEELIANLESSIEVRDTMIANASYNLSDTYLPNNSLGSFLQQQAAWTSGMHGYNGYNFKFQNNANNYLNLGDVGIPSESISPKNN